MSLLHTGAAGKTLLGLRNYAKRAIMPFGHDRAELSDLRSKAIERQRVLEEAKVDKAKAAGYLATKEELVKQAKEKHVAAQKKNQDREREFRAKMASLTIR